MLRISGGRSARLAELPDIASPARTWTGSVADLIDDDASLRTRLSANIDEIERVTDKNRVGGCGRCDPCDFRTHSRHWRRARCAMPRPALTCPIAGWSCKSSTTPWRAALPPWDDPQSRIPPHCFCRPPLLALVRTMVEQRSGIATAVRAARDEAAAALDALQTARQRVGEERAVPAPARARLTALLSKARESGHRAEIRLAVEAQDAGTIRWQAALARLTPWSGDARGARRCRGSERRADWRLENGGDGA